MSMNSFQRMENISPCKPLAMMRVLSPRPNSPRRPSAAMTASAAAKYPMRVAFTWRYVFTTRREFDVVSETTEATKPMKACRRSFSRSVVGCGRLALRKLYVPNHYMPE